MNKPRLLSWAPVACGLAVTMAISASARPYASGIRNEFGTVYFTLNESADNVQVIFNGGASTNDMGALARGEHSFNLGSNSSFEIHVTKAGGLGYQHADATGTNAVMNMISDDHTVNPLLSIYSPRGVAVNNNPSSPYFGRIYMGNGSAGTCEATGRYTEYGIFVLNADQSSAHEFGWEDIPFNPGFRMLGNGVSPFELKVNADDDNVYIADWSDGFGNLLVSDPGLSSIQTVFPELVANANGGTGVVPVGEGNNHGTITSMHIEGSLANGDLVVYTVDEDLQSDKTATSITMVNSVWRYDIGGASLPYANDGILMFTPGIVPNTGIRTVGQRNSLVRGANGYFYYSDYRYDGTDHSGIVVLDSEGGVLWNSRNVSTNLIGGNVDILRRIVRLAVSPDQKYLAAAVNYNTIWILPLVDGIPQIEQRLLLAAFGSHGTSSAIHMQGLAFDAANNLYAVNSADEHMRIFAPGGTATAVTTSDGNFYMITPETQVSVTASVPTTTEGSSAGQFTISRTGETSTSLQVSFTITGTAQNGTDYVTIQTNATFGPGITEITIDVTPIDDSIAEETETVTLTLDLSDQYAVVSPSFATVSILDNEPPQISITATQPTLLESYAFATATYQLSRLGDLSSALTVNVNYSGAQNGVDFTGPTTVNLSANAASTTFDLTSINNSAYSGDRDITATVAAGTGYVVGTPSTADVVLVDDEFPAGTVLFADDFNNAAASASAWTVNLSDPSEAAVDFEFDYSIWGIPPAPHGTDTKGAKMRVSFNTGSTASLSMSPNGLNLSGDYRLIFDSWINYNGPLAGGGPGSTQSATAGVGTSGSAVVSRLENPSDGIWFSWNGDAGTGSPTTGIHAGYRDFNAYMNGVWFDEASGVYAAGTDSTARHRSHPYYALWGGLSAPAEQVTAYPSAQTGQTFIGCLGMSWHRVAVTKRGNEITWTIDGHLIATVDASSVSLGNNVFVGYEDVYAGASSVPDLSFAIVDNLRVETVVDAPAEAPVLNINRVGNNVTLTWDGPFVLQEATSLTGSPSDWTDVVGNPPSGHTVDVSSGIRFFRLRE